MRVHFGGRLDYLSDEMCQMNTRIGCIACRQSRLGGFLPSLDHDPSKESSNGGDDDGDDASSSNYDDDEMTFSQWFTLCHLWQKRGSSFGYERVVLLLGGECFEICSGVFVV